MVLSSIHGNRSIIPRHDEPPLIVRYLSIVLEKMKSRKTSKLEKLWREAHDDTGIKANHKNERVETADS